MRRKHNLTFKPKKALSLFLCVLMLLSSFAAAPAAFASDGVSISAGIEALRDQFQYATGPKTGTLAIDYGYYSPVKENDTTKYPMIILVAGRTEGEYPGKQVEANDYANWSSIEYQARFENAGGCFILIARAPEEKLLYWNESVLYAPLKAAIDDFIAKNSENIDTSRISLGGWCFGGKCVYQMAAAYPHFFSAIIPMSPFYAPTKDELDRIRDVSVWMIGCKSDSVTNYTLYTANTWNYLKGVTNRPENCRLTSFDTFAPYDGTNHNVWYIASSDMFYPDTYSGMNTIDANGNTVTFTEGDAIISWLSRQYSSYDGEHCSCNCHSTNVFVRLFWKIGVLFYRLFGASDKRECACGSMHW